MHRRLRRVFQKLVGSALPFSILTGALLADRSETANPYAVVPARVGEYCTVCGSPLTEDDVALIVKGRRFPVDKSMVDVFLKNPQAYFRTKQIRGALFQEELQAAGATQSALTGGWFLFGLYILTGLVCAGLSGYIAVSKGLPAIPHFFAGFFLSVFGLLYVLTQSSHVKPGTVPRGLVKVPVTHAPVPCPACGNTNHPAAVRCAACGAVLAPKLQSDMARTQ
jgi:hypothetical protein